MNSGGIVHIVAGSFILLSLSPGAEASPFSASMCFLFFTTIAGLGLCQSGFSRLCPLNDILASPGIKFGPC